MRAVVLNTVFIDNWHQLLPQFLNMLPYFITIVALCMFAKAAINRPAAVLLTERNRGKMMSEYILEMKHITGRLSVVANEDVGNLSVKSKESMLFG